MVVWPGLDEESGFEAEGTGVWDENEGRGCPEMSIDFVAELAGEVEEADGHFEFLKSFWLGL